MRDEALARAGNPLWGTPLGQMHLRGEINAVQLSAGEKFIVLLSAYNRAIGAKSVASPSLEIGRGAAQPDPDTEVGEKIAERERIVMDEYEAVMRLIGSGTSRDRALRRLADGKAIDFAERRDAICGMDILAVYYHLTNSRVCA